MLESPIHHLLVEGSLVVPPKQLIGKILIRLSIVQSPDATISPLLHHCRHLRDLEAFQWWVLALRLWILAILLLLRAGNVSELPKMCIGIL